MTSQLRSQIFDLWQVTKDPEVPLLIDLSGNLQISLECDDPKLCFSCNWGEYKLLMIDPSIKYVSLPIVRGIHRCSLNTTRYECETKCRQRLIEKICQCPTNSGTTVGSNCLVGQYESCLLNFTGKEDALCKNRDIDSCRKYLLFL